MVWRRDYTASTVVFAASTMVFTASTVAFTVSTHSRNHSHSGGEIKQSMATEMKTGYGYGGQSSRKAERWKKMGMRR